MDDLTLSDLSSARVTKLNHSGFIYTFRHCSFFAGGARIRRQSFSEFVRQDSRITLARHGGRA